MCALDPQTLPQSDRHDARPQLQVVATTHHFFMPRAPPQPNASVEEAKRRLHPLYDSPTSTWPHGADMETPNGWLRAPAGRLSDRRCLSDDRIFAYPPSEVPSGALEVCQKVRSRPQPSNSVPFALHASPTEPLTEPPPTLAGSFPGTAAPRDGSGTSRTVSAAAADAVAAAAALAPDRRDLSSMVRRSHTCARAACLHGHLHVLWLPLPPPRATSLYLRPPSAHTDSLALLSQVYAPL